jgi:hypothetical protein
MSFIESILKKIRQDRLTFGDFSIDNITVTKDPFEFEHYAFALSLNKKSLGKVLLSKRLITSFAQNILREKNIVVLPDFIEASSIIILTEMLNCIEERYGICLEINHPDNQELNQTTDIMIAMRYKNIVSPVLLQISTDQIFSIACDKNIDIEDETEFDITLSNEQNISADIIGRLSIDDVIQLPSKLSVYLNSQIYIKDIQLYQEEDMEKEIHEIKEMKFPVVFQIRLGGMTFNKIRELLTSNNLFEYLNNKECRILLGNSIIANGEVNENKVRITKIFI